MTFTYYHVHIERVIDGDTVRLSIDLGFNTWRLNEPYRLARINAPELSTPDGVTAKGALEKLLYSSNHINALSVIIHGKDKYGRWLADIVMNGANVNDEMLNGSWAYPISLAQQLHRREP